jgi:hypothetical protein
MVEITLVQRVHRSSPIHRLVQLHLFVTRNQRCATRAYLQHEAVPIKKLPGLTKCDVHVHCHCLLDNELPNPTLRSCPCSHTLIPVFSGSICSLKTALTCDLKSVRLARHCLTPASANHDEATPQSFFPRSRVARCDSSRSRAQPGRSKLSSMLMDPSTRPVNGSAAPVRILKDPTSDGMRRSYLTPHNRCTTLACSSGVDNGIFSTFLRVDDLHVD